MSTSSRVTVNRCVSSFARSRMSPTSRSSRVASASTVSSDARCCSGSWTTPSSSAETWPRIAVSGVRSSCDTDIRKFRSISSTSASRPGHLPEPRRSDAPSSPGAFFGTVTS